MANSFWAEQSSDFKPQTKQLNDIPFELVKSLGNFWDPRVVLMSFFNALAVMSKFCLKECNGKFYCNFYCWWHGTPTGELYKIKINKVRSQRTHSMITWEIHIAPNGQGLFSADAHACDLLCQGRDERRCRWLAFRRRHRSSPNPKRKKVVDSYGLLMKALIIFGALARVCVS